MSFQKRIGVVIADDEDLARERIRQLLRDDTDVEILAECANRSEAIAAVIRLQPDLLFLDIQMPGVDGFGVVKKLSSEQLPLIIFITAYDEYAVKAFELHACDYLLKPFKKKRFQETLAWVKTQFNRRQNSDYAERIVTLLEEWKHSYLERIGVKEGDRLFFVKTNDIHWFEAEDNYVRIHAAGGSYLIRQTMRSLEGELDPRRFVRIHRTAIVNVERIRELQQWFRRDYRVVLQDGTKIPVGRRYRQRLRTVLGSVL